MRHIKLTFCNRSALTLFVAFGLLSAPAAASAETNYVFYTVEKVRWGTAEHQMALPRTFGSSPDMTPSALASEAFHRLKSHRGALYGDASLTLDPNFTSTGAANVTIGPAGASNLPVIVSEVYWTLTAAGVKEVRIPEVKKDALATSDVPFGSANLTAQLWQILPPGQPGPGTVIVGSTTMNAFEARRKLDSKDKTLVNAVKALLLSPTPYVRLRVVGAIKSLNIPRSEDALIPLLSDPDTGVKTAVLKSFEGAKAKKVLNALEKVVQTDADPSIQSAAARILSAAGVSKYASVVLYDKLKDKDDGVVMDAVQKLSKGGKPEVAIALVDVLSHKNGQIQEMAMKAIASLGNRDALRKVVETDSIGAKYRDQSAKALAAGTGDDADLGLRHLIVNGGVDDRVWGISEVAKRRRYKLVPDVIGGLNHTDAKVRVAAAKALGEIKDSKALAQLSKALAAHASEKDVFEAAIIAVFGGLSLDEVIRFSSDDDKSLRQLAIKSLSRFTEGGRPNARVLTVLKERLGDSDPEIKRSAAFALARLDDASVVAKLIELKADPDGTIREQVVIAVANSKHPKADELLLEFLEDTHAPAKTAAVEGLRKRKVVAAIQKLKFQARNRDANVRRAVMQALVELTNDKQWDEFFQIWSNALFDQDPGVKIWALRGLARRRDPRIPGLLSPLVRDADDDVKTAALEALGATGDPAAVEYITTGLLEAKSRDVKLAALTALEKLNLEASKKPIMEFVKNESDAKLKERANEVFDNLP
ncbi:MAG: HEAT repeat protein [Myxococcota bacterium]|jgi:HEAT repeat protein